MEVWVVFGFQSKIVYDPRKQKVLHATCTGGHRNQLAILALHTSRPSESVGFSETLQKRRVFACINDDLFTAEPYIVRTIDRAFVAEDQRKRHESPIAATLAAEQLGGKINNRVLWKFNDAQKWEIESQGAEKVHFYSHMVWRTQEVYGLPGQSNHKPTNLKHKWVPSPDAVKLFPYLILEITTSTLSTTEPFYSNTWHDQFIACKMKYNPRVTWELMHQIWHIRKLMRSIKKQRGILH